MSARSRVDALPWWRRALGPLPVGFRPPPERLVSLMLLWDGEGWLVQSGIGVGSEPVWQRHGTGGELVAMLAEGLGVSWTEAHTDVRALDPGTTLAAMAGHDGSVARWVQSCRAGVRGFTVSLDLGTGLVARLRPVDLMAGPPAGAPVDADVFTPVPAPWEPATRSSAAPGSTRAPVRGFARSNVGIWPRARGSRTPRSG